MFSLSKYSMLNQHLLFIFSYIKNWAEYVGMFKQKYVKWVKWFLTLYKIITEKLRE